MSSRVVVLENAICAAVVAIGLPTASAAQQPVVIPVEPPTRLEAFMARDGVVMISGSSRVGAVRSEPGTLIAVASRELTDAQSGERAIGLAVEVRGVERRDPDRVSYVDLEEIPPLLAALEYMSKLDRTATSLDRFEAHYATRGGLVISVFDAGFGMKGSLSSGLAGTATTEMEFGEFQRFRQLLQVAYDGLKTLREQ